MWFASLYFNFHGNSWRARKGSVEAIKRLKVGELQKIPRDLGQPVTGKKADLVLRCQVLFERLKTPTNVAPEHENVPLLLDTSRKKNTGDIFYNV